MIDKLKVRLVANCFTQIKGIGNEETLSHVVRFASIHLLLALVTYLDIKLFQMDVKIAFLYGNLDEEIHMDQPISFVSKDQEDKVCHLKRSIYSLKQSSRSWYFRFHGFVTLFGLTTVSKYYCSIYI